MEDLITKITETYFDKKNEVEKLDKEFAEIYEERVLIIFLNSLSVIPLRSFEI